MDKKYIIRRAELQEDSQKLKELFTEVFHPEPVGVLAETIFNDFPKMENKYWFIAQEKDSDTIIAAFALIPWAWEFQGLKLKIAEMGIVGTRENWRKKGIMRELNKEFDNTLKQDEFDFAVIQGIPGFYHKLGFYYSITFENHINVPLHIIPEKIENSSYRFSRAGLDDIPFMMEQDEIYRDFFSISVLRDEQTWKYLMTHSLKTEYGSEFWILENNDEKFCFRVPLNGFGKGLIVSEISEYISPDALEAVLVFCRQKAIEQNKPYIRLNLHNESTAGRAAISMGAEPGKPYAWQIKIHDRIKLLEKMSPVLEKRMENSCFKNFTGNLRLDFFQSGIDLKWEKSRLKSVSGADNEQCPNTFCINEDMFPALCLGHRTWQELQHNRPDIFPAYQYLRPDVFTASEKTGLLIDTLFPKLKSWVYEQY